MEPNKVIQLEVGELDANDDENITRIGGIEYDQVEYVVNLIVAVDKTEPTPTYEQVVERAQFFIEEAIDGGMVVNIAEKGLPDDGWEIANVNRHE